MNEFKSVQLQLQMLFSANANGDDKKRLAAKYSWTFNGQFQSHFVNPNNLLSEQIKTISWNDRCAFYSKPTM